MGKRVGVIIPVYNSQEYLERCIDSVLQQTYNNIYIVLINDCSTDHTQDICNSYSRRYKNIIYRRNEINRGVSFSRNVGLELCLKKLNVDYITFVDSDDYILPEFIQTSLTLLEKGGCDIAWLGCKWLGEKEKEIYSVDLCAEKTVMTAREILQNPEWRLLYCLIWGKVYKSSLFEGIRYPENRRYYEDGGTTYKLIYKANKIILSNTKIYIHCCNNESLTRSSFSMEKAENGIANHKEIMDFYLHNNEERLRKIAILNYVEGCIAYLIEAISSKIDKKDINKLKKEYHKAYEMMHAEEIDLSKTKRIKYGGMNYCPLFFEIYIIYLNLKRNIKK